MSAVEIRVGGQRLAGELLVDRAPRTCAAFLALLPLRASLIHARWSGEACWIPFDGLDLSLEPENPVREPAPGTAIFYAGGLSQAEILIAYGTVRFACDAGPISGNHFLTLHEPQARLGGIGRAILWSGSQSIDACLVGMTA